MIHILNRTRAINYNELDKSNSIQSDISNQSDISSKTPLFKHKLFNNHLKLVIIISKSNKIK